jgi:hypothetical protein
LKFDNARLFRQAAKDPNSIPSSINCPEMRLLFAVLTLGIVTVGPIANARECSRSEEIAAGDSVVRLGSWARMHEVFQKYSQCDDGFIAEGYSEGVARLLVDRWNTFPQLAALTLSDPSFKGFVLRHINSTLNLKDLKRISFLASNNCPRASEPLCTEIKATSEESRR